MDGWMDGWRREARRQVGTSFIFELEIVTDIDSNLKWNYHTKKVKWAVVNFQTETMVGIFAYLKFTSKFCCTGHSGWFMLAY